MTEVLWPPDLIPSAQTWTTNGNGATFNSPFVGTTKTYGRPGVRMGCTITLPPLKGEPRARMLAKLREIKDRGGVVWVPDFTTTLETGLPVRGSFAATELLATINRFESTTGWTGSSANLSASDRVMRATFTGGGTECDLYRTPGVAVTQYAPYALRSFIRNGSWNAANTIGPALGAASVTVSDYSTSRGLRTASQTVLAATTDNIFAAVGLLAGAGEMAGSFYEVDWTSLARCAQVDSSPNLLTYSDQIDHANWTKTRVTVSANANTGADGTATADRIIEDTSNNTHFFAQSYTRASTAEDWCAFGTFESAAGTRNVRLIIASDTTPTNYAFAFFSLSGSGSVSSSGVAGTATNVRAFIVDKGAGRYECFVVGRLPASTTAYAQFGLTSGGSASYLGDGTSALAAWRCGAVRSSVPVRGGQTTTVVTSGTTQTSNRLNVKGLPASTSGLLKAGDMVQIGGQINQLIAPLDSNAAGLGVLICGNPWRSPADNAPVIVNTPMCKMQMASDTIDIETGPGQFSPFQLELVEVIE
jgi:hypothetical protein